MDVFSPFVSNEKKKRQLKLILRIYRHFSRNFFDSSLFTAFCSCISAYYLFVKYVKVPSAVSYSSSELKIRIMTSKHRERKRSGGAEGMVEQMPARSVFYSMLKLKFLCSCKIVCEFCECDMTERASERLNEEADACSGTLFFI